MEANDIKEENKIFIFIRSHTPESDAASLSHLLSLFEIQRREVAKFKYFHILVHTIE